MPRATQHHTIPLLTPPLITYGLNPPVQMAQRLSVLEKPTHYKVCKAAMLPYPPVLIQPSFKIHHFAKSAL